MRCDKKLCIRATIQSAASNALENAAKSAESVKSGPCCSHSHWAEAGERETEEWNGRARKMPFGRRSPLEALALPGVILAYKYSQFRQRRREAASRRVTERELSALHHKIVSAIEMLSEQRSAVLEMIGSRRIEIGETNYTGDRGLNRRADHVDRPSASIPRQ